jgi:hypothetical protein
MATAAGGADGSQQFADVRRRHEGHDARKAQRAAYLRTLESRGYVRAGGEPAGNEHLAPRLARRRSERENTYVERNVGP